MEFTFTKGNLHGVFFVRKNEEKVMKCEVDCPDKVRIGIDKRLKTGGLTYKTRACK